MYLSESEGSDSDGIKKINFSEFFYARHHKYE